MNFTGKEFEDQLKEELVGKNVGYSCWEFDYQVSTRFIAKMKELGFKETDFGTRKQPSANHGTYLTYRGESIGEVVFKKQKGSYKYGSYEWTFKNFSVNLWNEDNCSQFRGKTFAEMLQAIDELLDKRANTEAKKLEQAKEIFQTIKDKLGTDDYGARQFIEFLDKKKYLLSN